MNIKKVIVVGSGTMGRGIAQWFAQSGVEVQLCDQVFEVAEKARELLVSSWMNLVSKGKFTLDEANQFLTNVSVKSIEDLTTADLCIEAIVEDFSNKRELFQALDQKLDPKVIFATNTSGLSISSLAAQLTIERQTRFLGLHFFNPAPLMKLVEIIPGDQTDQNLSLSLKTWFIAKGKKIAVAADSPGFIVNRVARNFYGESLHTLGQLDKEKISEIDQVMRDVGGFKMGPFELMDLIGIDINYQVTQDVWKSNFYPDRLRPHPIQRQLVERRRLGKKTKKGFYDYD